MTRAGQTGRRRHVLRLSFRPLP